MGQRGIPPRAGGSWVAGILLGLLGGWVGEAGAQCAADGLCDAAGVAVTPANGAVFRVECVCSGEVVICPAVSFHVVYDTTRASRVDIVSNQGLNVTGTCGVPTMGVFAASSQVQTCGKYEYPITPAGVGASQRVVRMAVVPLRYEADHTQARVCFQAAGGAVLPQRCVYFQVMTRPQTLFIAQGTGPAESAEQIVSPIRTTTGEELRLRVVVFHRIPNDPLDIGLRTLDCPPSSVGNPASCPSPELPNQRWEGPTVCTLTSNPSATNCMRQSCERTLLYTPAPEEDGQAYAISFQAVSQGPALLSPGVQPVGVGCGAVEGLCNMGPYKDLSRQVDYIVEVRIPVPEFTFQDANQRLYSEPGVLQSPPGFTLAGTPEEGERQPAAFINCPLRGFGVYAKKRGASQLGLELVASGEGQPDAARLGMAISETSFVVEDRFGDNPPGEGEIVAPDSPFVSYVTYASVTWTPPKEAQGLIFNVCVRAFDSESSSTRCTTVEVERCLYCTVEHDTLQSIAARFRTSWLQVWSANYAGWLSKDPELNTAPVTPWETTKNPDELHPGLLIRLGPVYKARHDVQVADLVHRFQTSRETLHVANPDIGNRTVLPAGSEVCILADICTHADQHDEHD